MLWPLFTVLVIAGIWSIYWWLALGWAKGKAAAERESLAQQGITLACDREVWGGYPFRFEFSCSSPVLSLKGDVTWHAAGLLVVALAYKPWHMIALVDGTSRLDLPDGRQFRLEHDRAVASVEFKANGEPWLSVEVPRLRSAEFGTWTRALFHARPAPAGAIEVAATVEGLQVRTASTEPLAIDQATFRGRVDPSLRLTIDRIEGRRNGVASWGSGVIELDARHRPMGKLSTETSDVSGLLDIVEPHLPWDDQQKANLKMVLGLLGKTARIDIVAQDGQVYIGPFKAAALAPLY